jgi:alkylated DNA repair dioxygenase AlkB
VGSLRNSEVILLADGEVRYFPSIFDDRDADSLRDELLQTIAWRQDSIKLFGRSIKQPRLTAWMGDPGAVYRYSGLLMEPIPWCDAVLTIRRRVADMTGLDFNSVLLNFYRNGLDSMGWHRDNEKELGDNPVIASVSFGAPRVFLLRRYRSKSDQNQVVLGHGSLLMMSGPLQYHWEHCLPKVTKRQALAVGPRVNLTFRQVNLTSS